jgi:hypothetical protein
MAYAIENPWRVIGRARIRSFVAADLRLISVANLAVSSHGSLNLGELTDEEAIYRRADHWHSA